MPAALVGHHRATRYHHRAASHSTTGANNDCAAEARSPQICNDRHMSMYLEDYDLWRHLAGLVDQITDIRKDAVDAVLLQRVKDACKASDKAVEEVAEILFDKLKCSSSEVRVWATGWAAASRQRCLTPPSLLPGAGAAARAGGLRGAVRPLTAV